MTSLPAAQYVRPVERPKGVPRVFSLLINPLYAASSSFTQGELEGAKPASNQIKCRAKPCLARRAWSEAIIFVPQGGTKITTLFQAVEKSRRLFRQPDPWNAQRAFHGSSAC